MKLLTHNLGLKLIAFALAIIIYYSLKTRNPALVRDMRNDRSQQQR